MFTGVLFVVHNSLIFESGNADTLFFVGGSENNCPVSGVQVPDAYPSKKIFFVRQGHLNRLLKSEPQSLDSIDDYLFCQILCGFLS